MSKVVNTSKESFYDGYKPILIFVGILMLIYAKNLGFTFSYLDDDLLIINNAFFFNNNSWSDVFGRDVFLNGLSAFYRPIQAMFYYFVYHLWDGSPSGFFLFNILVHTGTVISLFYLLLELKIERKISFWTTLFFALNPLFVHSVSWIPSSGDLIMGFTIILSFIFFLKSIKEDKLTMTVLHLAFFGIGLFTKESTILFPVIPLIYYFLGERSTLSKKQFNYSVIGWIILVIIYFMARSNSIDMARAEETFSISFIFDNIFAIPELIFKFFLPIGLSPAPRFTNYKVIGGMLIFGAILSLIYKSKDIKNPIFIFGLFWSIVILIPTLTFKHQMSDQTYQYLEHRAYVPFLGLIPIIALLIQKYKMIENKNFLYFLIGYVGIFGFYSYAYSFNYKNPDKFYGRVITVNPQDPMAHYNRGVARHQKNRIDEALQDYNKALEIKPNYQTVHNNRAIAYSVKKQFALAIPEFTKAIEYNPNYADFYANRGNAYASINEFEKALADYSQSLILKPNDGKIYFYRANVKFKLGMKDDACADAQKSAELGFQNGIEIFNKYCR